MEAAGDLRFSNHGAGSEISAGLGSEPHVYGFDGRAEFSFFRRPAFNRRSCPVKIRPRQGGRGGLSGSPGFPSGSSLLDKQDDIGGGVLHRPTRKS